MLSSEELGGLTEDVQRVAAVDASPIAPRGFDPLPNGGFATGEARDGSGGAESSPAAGRRGILHPKRIDEEIRLLALRVTLLHLLHRFTSVRAHARRERTLRCRRRRAVAAVSSGR